MGENKQEEKHLADKAADEDPFEIQMRLLYGFEMGIKDHSDKARDEPFEHDGKVFTHVKPGADLVGENNDKKNEDGRDRAVYDQGCGGDGGFFFFIAVAANVADMRIFKQTAFGGFEYRRDDQEQGPGAHLLFVQSPDEDDQVNEAKEGDGEPL
jgi:hypothetical protein